MLQQTQAVTVAKRYRAFTARFPTVKALARAPLAAVCEAWAGLGYYARARNLHAAARVVATRHGGRLPTTAEALDALPGVGRYTAAAVASIAYGEAVPVVDGNVARFLSRLFAVEDPPSRAAGRHRLWSIAATLVAGSEPGDLNQALMEIGACVCTPREPDCGRCPVRRWCEARAQEAVETFPRRMRSLAPRPELTVTFAWLEDARGVWLERLPPRGLWGGQWQLPGEQGAGARSRLARRLNVRLGRTLARLDHELTHRRVRATVLDASAIARPSLGKSFRRFRDLENTPVSAITRRSITQVLARRAGA